MFYFLFALGGLLTNYELRGCHLIFHWDVGVNWTFGLLMKFSAHASTLNKWQ
jgi:hypothetical protein